MCSSLWQLTSDEYHKLTRSWNTAVKMIWDLPHSTHIRLLEPLSPVTHLESVLTGRYIGFVESLSKSAKPLVRLLFSKCSSDLGSQTGQNINFLLNKHSKPTLNSLICERNIIKKGVVSPVSENEKWKLPLIEELCLIQKGFLVSEFDEPELGEILNYICTD